MTDRITLTPGWFAERQEAHGLLATPGTTVDMRSVAPMAYRVCERDPEEVTSVTIHQMGVGCWKPDNSMFARVRAHYVVQRCGRILRLHSPEIRLRYGSGQLNATTVTVEHEGNYPSVSSRWWKSDTYGRDDLADHPDQVHASRQLLTDLVKALPHITEVQAHRHISAGKANCPGPDLWREVGQWAIEHLGLREGPTLRAGLPLPEGWQGPPRLSSATLPLPAHTPHIGMGPSR